MIVIRRTDNAKTKYVYNNLSLITVQWDLLHLLEEKKLSSALQRTTRTKKRFLTWISQRFKTSPTVLNLDYNIFNWNIIWFWDKCIYKFIQFTYFILRVMILYKKSCLSIKQSDVLKTNKSTWNDPLVHQTKWIFFTVIP